LAGERIVSFTTVVVAEDPTNNGYILKPLVTAVLKSCGRPRAKVSVLSNPRTTGYEHAKQLLKNELIERYKFVDLLLFLPDADGKDRSLEFQALENQAHVVGTKLICCAAAQEVETWLLAGHIDKLQESWMQIRLNSSVKEDVFQSFLAANGDQRLPGGGREQLMIETLGNYAGLKSRCPEIEELEKRIRDLFA
jgi:hypothetical protein